MTDAPLDARQQFVSQQAVAFALDLVASGITDRDRQQALTQHAADMFFTNLIDGGMEEAEATSLAELFFYAAGFALVEGGNA